MEKAEILRNKKLYKIFLIILKYIPIIIGFCYILSTMCSLIGHNLIIFSMFGGISILTLLFLLIVSFVFNFCLYHRIFLYYAALIDIINWIDYLWFIPISTFNLLILESILAGLTIIIAIIAYVKYHKKPSSSNN